MTDELTPRHRVIDIAVQLEFNISNYLKVKLDIRNDDSRSFDKGSSLSFQQKLNLILDLDVLTKDEVLKFELFGQIRNKFAHKVEIETFADCIDSDKHLRNKLVKLYSPEKEVSQDFQYRSIFIDVLIDITAIGVKLVKDLENK
jgi:hypothetical protein